MDDVLAYADKYALDNLYIRLFPSSSYAPSPHLLTTPTVKDSLCTFARSIANIGVDPTIAASSVQESLFPRDSILRQLISLLLVAWGGSMILYFSVSTISYYLLFDRRLEHHPRFLKNQIRKEIALSVKSMPVIAGLIVPWFVAECRGATLMYDDIRQYGGEWFKGTLLEGYGHWVYVAGSMTAFLLFTDFCIYWIHRWLHIPWLYKRVHKPHHKWVVPTPFAALAFHPLDGYAQSVPYHIIPFMLPLHKWIYLVLFIIVNLWTIIIHDGDMISGHFLEKYINSPAHHTLHHLYFTCNYGQYFTWADSMGGSYRPPRPDLDPIHDAIKNMERKRKLAEKDQRDTLRRSGSISSSGDFGVLPLTEVSPRRDGGESDSGYEGSETELVGIKKGAGKKGDAEMRRRK